MIEATTPPPRVKCLLVDDLDENLMALTALLRRDDVEILQARSGPEALELLLAHPDVALAFLDVQMPEMDGFELAELMRGSERTREIPIIFVTAGGKDQTRLFKGYESGAVDFLYKPIEPHVLRSKAQVFFELHLQKQQLKAQLEELRETLRLNEMFTAVLGHDLRDPLNVVLTASQLLEISAPDETLRRTAQRVGSSGKRMVRMIEDLLDLSRARLAGGIPLSKRRLDLGRLVEKVVQEFQTSHPTRTVELERKGDLFGEWDGDRLFQLTANLLSNALHHGTPEEAVRIHLCGELPEHVVLQVENHGAIPRHLVPNLFNPFGGRANLPGGKDGLGLGLYIACKIAEAHQGKIAVDTGAEDKTIFHVEVPRQALEVLRL